MLQKKKQISYSKMFIASVSSCKGKLFPYSKIGLHILTWTRNSIQNQPENTRSETEPKIYKYFLGLNFLSEKIGTENNRFE